MNVRSDGSKANENFLGFLRNRAGDNGEHVSIKLIDSEDIENNQYVITQQYTFRSGKRNADIGLLRHANYCY